MKTISVQASTTPKFTMIDLYSTPQAIINQHHHDKYHALVFVDMLLLPDRD